MNNYLQFKEGASAYWVDFLPQHCAFVLQALPDVVHETPLGRGNEMAPWRMSSIGQWAAAAEIKLADWKDLRAANAADLPKIAPDRGLYWVGGRLLERTPAGTYDNYITDVLDGGKALFSGAKPPAGSTGVTNLSRARGFAMKDKDADKHVYDVKYDRLASGAEAAGLPLDNGAANKVVARQARRVLQGKPASAGLDELPGTVAAMFLAEVSREKRMLVLGLMLLDLIEAQVAGFSWDSLMTAQGALAGGVQHPMVHFGAQNEAKVMFQNFNAVTRKSVEILVAWLNLRLARGGGWAVQPGPASPKTNDAHKGFTGKMKQATDAFPATAPTSAKGGSIWRFYHEAVLPALKARADSLDFML